MQARLRKKLGSGEKILRWELSIYRGTGGLVPRNCLDKTVARNLEDACPLRRSEGDVFTRIQGYSWNRIVGVNPLPRGASVGEFGKTLTPSKHRVCQNSWDEFADHYRNDSFSFM
jgi:hypothetical protein